MPAGNAASSSSDCHRRPLRTLLIGQAIAPGETGGLTIALRDVAEHLARHDWSVETAAYAPDDPAAVTTQPAPDARLTLRPTNATSRLAWMSRWRLAGWIGQQLPRRLRYAIELVSMPPSFWRSAAVNLARVDALLSRPDRYDVVLLAPSTIDAPGLTALATARHSRVVLIGLDVVGLELGAWWWPWLRAVVRWRLDGSLHPFLLERFRSRDVALGIFASRQWQDEAVRSGFPVDRARLVPFAVPLAEPLPRRSGGRPRVLWVGRLSREKGLHLLLDALPVIRRSVPDVTVTAIAAQGPAGYRRQILATIRRLGLENCVDLRPAVPRGDLGKAYSEHDLLFFHSPYRDPVALVLMEAFAAGLPVVASSAAPDAQLVHDGSTCLCYRPGSRESAAKAVVHLLRDGRLRDDLADNAGRLVRDRFTPEGMGRAYDDLLRGILPR